MGAEHEQKPQTTSAAANGRCGAVWGKHSRVAEPKSVAEYNATCSAQVLIKVTVGPSH